ncbi:MAG: M48 family metallopeptidase [Flavobacteriaceae bacterium]|nr:M48 family metallopeptidase [Flavobacteriaceae bacterium]
MKKNFILCFIAFLLFECSTVPITGRKRVNFVNDDKVLPASFTQYSTFLKENKLSNNKEMSAQVKQVGSKVSAAVDRFMRANNMVKEANAYKWEFNLVEDKKINAWCLPGGKVVFYTGIMPICENENGVAAVMGHEVAHAFAKHGQERMSERQIQQVGGIAVALGTMNEDSKKRQIWNMVYGIGSSVGMLAYSRTHETEADKLGLVFMIMAGYDGKEAAEVWVRMNKRSGKSKTPQFLSTHPSNEQRIKTLREFLPEAKKLAAKYNSQTLN